MIYFVIVIDGKEFIPSINAFTNKKDAEAFKKKQIQLSLKSESETGFDLKIHTREMPWKNTKKDFCLYMNHYLGNQE